VSFFCSHACSGYSCTAAVAVAAPAADAFRCWLLLVLFVVAGTDVALIS